MAEASTSTSMMSQAALLREAAKQTMRRKQAPDKYLNGTAGSISSVAPSSPSNKSIPTHPRAAGLTSTISLNYGEPNENFGEGSFRPQSPTSTMTVASAPPTASKLAKRTSATKAKSMADEANMDSKAGVREEGEISDEETKTKRTEIAVLEPLTQERGIPSSSASATASTNGTSTGSPLDIASSTRLGQARSTKVAQTPRHGSLGGVQRPPFPANVHREPASTGPTTSLATKTNDTPRWSLPTRHSAAPVPQTHSFSNLEERSRARDDLDRIEPLSPRTSALTEEFFTRLLELGVDDDHCRPGLPMTFEEFNVAKSLMLDLLGMGLTPEDIAEVGINKRLVVYCLRELKIRLPSNITIDDIVPFGPPEYIRLDVQMSGPSPLPSSQEQLSPSGREHEPTSNDMLIVEDVKQELTPSPLSQRSTELERPASTEQPVSPPNLNSAAPSGPMSKFNINATPFTPSQPMPSTSGPSLLAMALPHQRILPPRPASPVSQVPIPLPPRPMFDIPTKLPSKPITVERSPIDSTMESASPSVDPPPSETGRELQRLEQQTKMQLLRRKLELSKKRVHGKQPPVTAVSDERLDAIAGNIVSNEESATSSTLLSGQRHSSPDPMEVDVPLTATSSIDPAGTPPTMSSLPARPSSLPSRISNSRSTAVSEGTRPSTPLEIGPKRGVKRPKADDFVEDVPAKRSARIGGAPPPVKRSSFAIFNSQHPEQHIITWSDDEGVEIDETSIRSREASGTPNVRDVDAVQLAAAAMALGLPMTAEELEAARLQEEKRKAEFEAKSRKLKETQLRLKKLEARKIEKKLQMLEANHAESSQIAVARATLHKLKQEITEIETQLPNLSMQILKSAEHEGISASILEGIPAPSTTAPNTPASLTPSLDMKSDPPLDVALPTSQTYEIVGRLAQDTTAIDSDEDIATPEHDSDVKELGGSPPEVTSLKQEDEDKHAAEFERLHQDAAAQTRFSAYSPPSMLSAIPSLQHPESTSFSSTDASAASNRATDLSISKQFPAANLPNPDGVLCQFEANGGECRDPACGDLHFKDFLISESTQP